MLLDGFRIASIRRVDHDHGLKDPAPRMADVDIVLTKGYRRSNAPKIEVSRQAHSRTLLCSYDELLAVASDYPVATDVPQYGLNDVQGLADLIEAHFLAGPSAPPGEQ
ncbi:MAG: molybdopterin-guanine dinucleotide biosynthesis protein MobB [Anaerolineae bacterium]|jgi:molybdopterin-guanine dinucleotide biosynthesis protein B